MKVILISMLVLTSFSIKSQSLDYEDLSRRILEEGIDLYRNELASWISTDSIKDKKQSQVKGYFTYRDGNFYNSIYYDSIGKVAVYKFIFRAINQIDIELVRQESNTPLSEIEVKICEIRKSAFGLASYWYKNFGYTEIVNPNVIIYKTSPSFEVYVIPGTWLELLPMGGDLRLSYNDKGKFLKFDPIHNNLIPFDFKIAEEMVSRGHVHKGKRMNKEFITSTDICTLLLYRRYLSEDLHTVSNRKVISEFYFNEPRLIIRPKTKKQKG